MKEEYNQHIGIYDESVPLELCNGFVENWEEAKNNQTIVDLSKENDFQVDISPGLQRKDESAFVAPLFSTIFPRPPVKAYFEYLGECFQRYVNKYGIIFDGVLYNEVFKIHKVRKSEGYHAWHYENGEPEYLNRLIVYMTYLEAPEEGGETEFLEQKLRIKPKVGKTLIWPAGYTHMHRGMPPLSGEKMYIDGWFSGQRISNRPPGK